MLNIIEGLLKAYWLDLIISALVLSVLVILWRRGKRDAVKHIVRELVARAEQQYGSGTGPIKLAFVWSGIYNRLPWIVRTLYTKEELQKYIEDAVTWLKVQLADGMNLLTYGEEKAKEK